MNTINLETWLLKSNHECRGFRVVEPTNKNNITLRFTHLDVSCTYSLNDNTLKEAIDKVFNHLAQLGMFFYKTAENAKVKNKLYKILNRDHLELKEKLGEKYSKFNSLSGLFYKKTKLIGFLIYEPKNSNYSLSLSFNKAGLKSCSRSIDAHGFNEAYNQVFKFACKQMNISLSCSSVAMFKSIIKQDLIREYQLKK
jgi:hypothetical protein